MLLLVLSMVVCCLGGATNPNIAAANNIAVVKYEPGDTAVSCAAPAMYIIVNNGASDNVVGLHYTFDSATDPAAVWISALNSRHSTCRFTFNGNNDQNRNNAGNDNAVNCANVPTNCRRCIITGPCLCDRMTADTEDLTLSYKYIWQDNDDVMEESAVQTTTIKISRDGKPGCPVNFNAPDVLTQLANQPDLNQNVGEIPNSNIV